MACTTFSDCISYVGPAQAEANFGTVKHLSYYAVNFLFNIFYAFLIIYIIYNFALAVYKLILGGDDEETFKVVKDAFFKALIAAVGLMFLIGARYILASALTLAGITGVNNPFSLPDPIP